MSTGMATPLPQWMRLLGAGLTGLLAVLFVVVLQQTREQGQRLQQLQDKVQTIENANDLERTNALEDQLRSTVERLQTLEGIEQKVQSLSSQVQTLRDLQRSRWISASSLVLFSRAPSRSSSSSRRKVRDSPIALSASRLWLNEASTSD